MNSIEKLSEIFARFPGIGPRQAKRFVYFLLSRNGDYPSELTRAIQSLKKEIIQCGECMRFFVYPEHGRGARVCSICADEARDNSMLMIVPRDIDLEAVERSGSYNGHYFILGGVVPILEKEPEKRIRIKELESRIKKDKNIKEIILAMNANLDGENTAEFIKQKYQGLPLIFSTLGRGLSTGAELEYADPETLKNAFLHRTK
ncbi:MAG: recombination protein RecR [Candidatus Zambryskibacteria bacterium RIFCSPHIGHO2_01_FULL_46_30]|uniref:Recombination protein RecR n=1 Tax=Candidatus Zambryskibacteria bacterium RIFCSPHIGHO2_01_FULL_46_30 TaxID=1802739 RepID=A0A1G2T370_9BACT|nr:MAG: recombination protein RecR [Candidatus Zambryskibacteria bacterium RIFCSPHIGHO2_01_FULL_46_30]OHB06441.1 MAG: recombination protein RecR [Candidatus Zambryskibacteria bacterium RIFCSPLOWO2_01_FULL_47_33]